MSDYTHIPHTGTAEAANVHGSPGHECQDSERAGGDAGDGGQGRLLVRHADPDTDVHGVVGADPSAAGDRRSLRISWDGGGSIKGYLFPPAGGQLVFKLQLPAVETPVAALKANALAAADCDNQPDYANVRILTKTGELCATADSAYMIGVMPIIFFITSPATVSGTLIPNALYTFLGITRDGGQQQFTLLYSGEESDGVLAFVI